MRRLPEEDKAEVDRVDRVERTRENAMIQKGELQWREKGSRQQAPQSSRLFLLR